MKWIYSDKEYKTKNLYKVSYVKKDDWRGRDFLLRLSNALRGIKTNGGLSVARYFKHLYKNNLKIGMGGELSDRAVSISHVRSDDEVYENYGDVFRAGKEDVYFYIRKSDLKIASLGASEGWREWQIRNGVEQRRVQTSDLPITSLSIDFRHILIHKICNTDLKWMDGMVVCEGCGVIINKD